ncbi:major facilitator superfamily MFS-1 [Phlegmacium glaucopus]|nr:major facilitator superfamily MFS-1 [Phlegmacium glaucopus]
MTASNSRSSSVPVRSFGTLDPTNMEGGNRIRETSVARRFLSRISLGNLRSSRQSFASIRREGEAALPTPKSDPPPIPTMMQHSGEAYSTPLPKLSMIVLSITMLGEFLSANVSTPFLLFMVRGFGEFQSESEVAFWTGILVSTFFLTQFLTSLLWATVAEKHGRRVVLMISLLGSALTCLVFGTSTTLQQAICIRLLQGIFAGAVGVARGCVAFVTDPSNEGRAYAILGFCWGLGGVAGAIIGGAFERPVEKWPGIFGNVQLFVTYPYLLPCGLAASITFIGSILSCFLANDAGPREGAIKLQPEKFVTHTSIPEVPEEATSPSIPPVDEEEPHALVKMQSKFSRRFSDYFAHRVPSSEPPMNQPAFPLASPNPHSERSVSFSRTSRANGSAYGYSGSYRNRVASNTTFNPRRGSLSNSMRRRRGSAYDNTRDSSNEGGDLNFAQRLLLANENAVTNIADLWVAAAMNVDNENPFEADSDIEDDDANSLELGVPLTRTETMNSENDPSTFSPPFGRTSRVSGPFFPRTNTINSLQPSIPVSYLRHSSSVSHPPSVSFMAPHSPRRQSTNAPSIFAHPGVKTPTAVLDAQQLLNSDIEPLPESLQTITESRQASQLDAESLPEKPPSLMSQLPILVIIQYGVMALHTTTHDQVFMSYLVSDKKTGGLNLNAGDFAQLIALMCLAQIAYQFYLYPNIGPPRGRFSHLAMFRLGTLMYIPAYLTVVLYQPLARADKDKSNPILMLALTLSTAVRYCGITFGYTSISILLNYMTPPSVVGYANGIAQSMASLARCLGPVIGGYLWAISVEDHPSGYYLGFVVCAGVCALSVLQSFLIR